MLFRIIKFASHGSFSVGQGQVLAVIMFTQQLVLFDKEYLKNNRSIIIQQIPWDLSTELFWYSMVRVSLVSEIERISNGIWILDYFFWYSDVLFHTFDQDDMKSGPKTLKHPQCLKTGLDLNVPSYNCYKLKCKNIWHENFGRTVSILRRSKLILDLWRKIFSIV